MRRARSSRPRSIHVQAATPAPIASSLARASAPRTRPLVRASASRTRPEPDPECRDRGEHESGGPSDPGEPQRRARREVEEAPIGRIGFQEEEDREQVQEDQKRCQEHGAVVEDERTVARRERARDEPDAPVEDDDPDLVCEDRGHGPESGLNQSHQQEVAPEQLVYRREEIRVERRHEERLAQTLSCYEVPRPLIVELGVEAEGLEEGHQHKEHDEIVDTLAHPLPHVNALCFLLPTDPLAQPLIQLRATQRPPRDGRQYQGYQPPDDQDDQGCDEAWNASTE